ncbi:hypothetical protein MPDQ_003936 [Monascus purpureus]|uniref:Alpha-1,2-mannosyltransferase (Mnn2) n=1 Tax=Monascus purpureus TaxID=5098 RepID=A0A507R1N3_MONPU|nr:hypothetical protein MPDQ_003936 [Monascus purpureus]
MTLSMTACRPWKPRAILPALGVMLVVSFISLYGRVAWVSNQQLNLPMQAEADAPLRTQQAIFWRNFQPLMEEYNPNCPSPSREDSAGAITFDAVNPPQRPDVIILPDADRETMQQAHSSFVNAITNSTILRSAHIPGSSGIVSSAGKTYLPLFVTSLRMLRRTGSELPVELFLKDSSEYETKICEEVLPSLNAQCVVLSDILRLSRFRSTVQIAHYQLKIFAVLFSSFEKVIWMDSDCFPLHDPSVLLNSEPFTSKGLVTWPDFWASTASPLYYNISQQPIPPMDARASSETGVFLVSKQSHFLSLLLAAYYNYYGPSHYFSLLSQGAPGEGDKETFIQAASALNQDFYTVSERVAPVGHLQEKGGISGSAMVQSDPIEDYRLTSQNKWRVKDKSVAKPPRVFFIHAHYPKFNPADKLFGYQWETAPTVKPDGTDGRAWVVPNDVLVRLGYDAERAYWEEIKWVSCNLERVFESWREVSGVCSRVQEYWLNVFEDPSEYVPQFTES